MSHCLFLKKNISKLTGCTDQKIAKISVCRVLFSYDFFGEFIGNKVLTGREVSFWKS